VLVPVPLPVLVPLPVPLPVLVPLPVPLPVLVPLPVPLPVLVPLPLPVLLPVPVLVPVLEPLPEWPASAEVSTASGPEAVLPPHAKETAETENARRMRLRAVRMGVQRKHGACRAGSGA
jgi:hypothetical protein